MSPLFVLHNTLGAMFIGMVLATSLHGISIVQALYYYTHHNDTWHMRLLVAAVMVCDTVHQALITHSVYMYSITHWGNPEQLGNIVQSLIVEVLFNGLIAFLVQGFLTVRLWKLSHGNLLLITVMILFVLAEFVSSVVFTILGLQLHTFAQLVETLKSLSLAVNALAAVGDVLIAGALCTMLHLSRTGFQRSDTIINKLILFAVNTGLLTSFVAVASLISYLAAPNTFLYIGFYFCIGRLYTNALLATLNARKMILNSSDNVHSNTMSLSLRDLPKNASSSNSQRGPGNISIKINTIKEFVTDLEQDNGSDKIEYLQTSNASGGFEEKGSNV